MPWHRLVGASVGAAMLVSGAGLSATADEVTATQSKGAAADVTAERQVTMKRLRGGMQSLDAVLQENGDEDAAQEALRHAQLLRALARELPALFPEDSAGTGSRAKPEVWERREEFEQAAAELERKLETFARVARDGDAARTAQTYRELDIQATCARCHETFRSKSR